MKVREAVEAAGRRAITVEGDISRVETSASVSSLERESLGRAFKLKGLPFYAS